MKKNKIDKKKFLFKFLENFSSSSDVDETIMTTLSQMKISKDKIQEVRTEILPNGFKSLMIEVNQIINERLRSEKKLLKILKLLELMKKLFFLY